MTMKDANEVLEEAEEYRTEVQAYLREAADFFHERSTTLMTRDKALTSISEALDIDRQLAGRVLSGIVGDRVDPVVQVPAKGAKHIGVIQYQEGEGWYGYVNYDDVVGHHKRAVCAKCVEEAHEGLRTDEHVTVSDAGRAGHSIDCHFNELGESIKEHYENEHDEKPEEVETGATLLSGTTIGGNTAWHQGNDGSGSGLDTDLIRGQAPAVAFSPPIFGGDNITGSISFSSSQALNNGLYEFDTWEVQAGTTLTVESGGVAVVTAGTSITVDGTIQFQQDGAAGGTGGAGSTGGSNSGDPGAAGTFSYGGDGGRGGDSSFSNNSVGDNGGAGGVGTNWTPTEVDTLNYLWGPGAQQILNDAALPSPTSYTGSGGGGGGSGAPSINSDAGGSGGDGGQGATGALILIAPEITINGAIQGSGQDGQDGGNGSSGSTNESGGGGGGGGGGGPAVLLAANAITGASNITVSGGAGGAGGTATGDGEPEDGTPGQPGGAGTFLL